MNKSPNLLGLANSTQLEFLRQLSGNPANTVIGIVRDPKTAEPKITSEIGRANIHIIQGDLDDYDSLKVGIHSSTKPASNVRQRASDATKAITGGSVDYLIANGGRQSLAAAFIGLGKL
jgi:hypothetical protein